MGSIYDIPIYIINLAKHKYRYYHITNLIKILGFKHIYIVRPINPNEV